MQQEQPSKANPCFDCQKALGGCRWSRSFKPIPGWDATPDGAHGGYTIHRCPEFVPDPPRQYVHGILSEEDNEKFLKRRRQHEISKDAQHLGGLKSSWAMACEGKSRRRHKR